MKRNLFSTLAILIAFVLTTVSGMAEITDPTFASVNLTTAGTLSTVLKGQGYDLTKISNIVVTGKINSRDFNTLGKTMVNLVSIDLSGTNAEIIPDETFRDRQQLKSFKGPNSLHKIGNMAFNNCYQLTTFNFTANIDSIGDNAFNSCSSLKDSIQLSEKFSYLGSYAFYNCNALKQVDLSASTKLTTIGGNAFGFCYQLTSVLLPNSLNYLQWGIFYYCTALVEMDLSRCTNLSSLNSGNIFAGCSSLKRITLPSSLSTIGSEFSGCSSLESFTILSSNVPSSSTTTFGDIPLSTCTLYVPIGAEDAYFNAPNWYFETILGIGVLPTIGAHGLVKADGAYLRNGIILNHQQKAVAFEAIPESGYEVDQFVVNGNAVQLTNNTYQLPAGIVGATIQVSFKLKQFHLTVQSSGNGALMYKGKTLQTPYILDLDSATSAGIIVKPEAGFVIESLTFNGLNCTVQQDSIFNTPTIHSDASLTVTFASATEVGTLYKYAVETGQHGSIVFKNTPLLPSTAIMVKAGESAQFTITPDNYYLLDKLLVNGIDRSASVVNNSFTLDNALADATLSASFKINPVVSVNVAVPSTLSSYLFKEQRSAVTKLTLSGSISSYDFTFIRDSLRNLNELDIKNANLVAIGGHKSIPYYAFNSHPKLSNIVFPEDLWGIEGYAFSNCVALNAVHLPASISNIGDNPFSNCQNLVSLHLDALVPPTLTNSLGGAITLVFVPKEAVNTYKNASGWSQYTILSPTGTSVTAHVAAAGTLSSVITQQGVALTDVSNLVVTGTLNSEDFRVMNKSMTQLTAIDLSGSTIDAIPNSAFEGKTQLLSFKAPSNIKTIGEKAFSGCRLMTDIPLGNQIATIGNRAFENCASMSGSIVFPPTLSSMGEYAFSNCARLDTVDFSACTRLSYLNNAVFENCTGLTSVFINPSICTIGYQTFNNCASLKSIDLSYCKSLSLNHYSFGNCTSLQFIGLPASIYSINSYAFPNCPQLKKIAVYSIATPILQDNAITGVNTSTCELFVPTGSASSYSTAPNWSSFATIKEMGVKVTIGSNGMAIINGDTLENGQVVFHNEAAVDLNVLPNPGYEIATFSVNGQSTPITGNRFHLDAGSQSATFGVSFRLKKFSLQVSVKGEGSLKQNTALYKDTTFTITADSASSVVFSVLPATGYTVDSIRFNDRPGIAQKNNTLYVSPLLSGSSELTVQFSPKATLGTFYKMEVISGKNGSVEYLNTPLIKDTTDVLIQSGSAAVFCLKPAKGYLVDKVSYNGINVTSKVINNQYALTTVSAAGKIMATFRVDPVVSVHVKVPGSLSGLLTADQKKGVTNLTLTGYVDANDFYYMRDSLDALSVLDLRQVTVGYVMEGQVYGSIEIPNNAFCKDWSNGKKTLTEIYLPINTQFIREMAFTNCSNLKDVHFELCTGLQSIGNSAFNGTSLKTVSLPGTLTTLANSTFNNNQNLVSVDLSKTAMTTIPSYCFSSCGGLLAVKLPPNVTTIESGSFTGCSKLRFIDFSTAQKLTSIEQSAFSSTSIESITFPASLKTIGDGAFQYCYTLKSVDLSACTSLLNLNANTFSGSGITKVSFPINLVSIGMCAFEGCNITGTVELPASVAAIGDRAFNYNYKLTFCKSDATTPPVLGSTVFPSGMVAVFVQEQCIATYEAATGWEDYDIIGGEKSVTVHVSMPGTLATSIMEQTGVAPRLVTTMVVTGDLNAVDFENMRTNMPLLYNLDLSGTDVLSIPEGAFRNKSILMKFKAPEYLAEIKPNAFENCSNLKDTLILPDGVMTIGNSAFINCNSLTGIKLPKRLMTIGDHAFEGCNAINQSLTFSTKIKNIGYYAFSGCTLLKDTLTLPYSLETLGDNAFANCGRLTLVDLSNCSTIKSIPSYAFTGCTSLSKVVLSNTVTNVSDYVFSNCPNLSTINFPLNLVSIGNYTFDGCASLVGIDLSRCKLLNSVGAGAFQSCLNLKTVNLSPVLMSIGSMAFSNNTALINISTMNETPATLGDNVFYKVKTKRCVLSIPKDAYNDYLNASQWGSFVQMSKTIDVIASTGGTVAFTSLDSVQTVNSPAMAPRMAAGTVLRAMTAPTIGVDPSAALIENGARICVLDNQALKFYITPDEGSSIEWVRYNNVDVTDQVVNGIFSSPSVSTSMGSIEIKFTNGAVDIEQTKENKSKCTTTVYAVNGTLYVENEKEIQQVIVLDTNGVQLIKSNEKNTNHQFNNLSKGIYIVRIILTSGKVETIKMVI